MKKILCLTIALLLVLAALFSFASCTPFPAGESDTSVEETLAAWQRTYTAGEFGIHNKNNPFVVLSFSNGDTVRLELYANVAPISVANFISYVKAGFYEGTVIHRVLKGQCIQGGGFMVKNDKILHKDPLYDEIVGEFARNGIRNDLKHTRGVISMARTNAYDSATSQFFLCAGTVSGWNGLYAAFGKVIDEESMAAIERINSVTTQNATLYYGTTPVTSSDVPSEIITITKATLVMAD